MRYHPISGWRIIAARQRKGVLSSWNGARTLNLYKDEKSAREQMLGMVKEIIEKRNLANDAARLNRYRKLIESLIFLRIQE